MFNIKPSLSRGFIDSDNKKIISYQEINLIIKKNLLNLNKLKKSLFFLFSDNSVNSAITYITLMKSKHVVLILDHKIDKNFINLYIKNYKPNYLIYFKYEKFFKLKNNFSIKKGIFNEKILLLKNKKQKLINFDKKLKILLTTSGTTGNVKLVKISEQSLKDNTEKIIKSLKINVNDTGVLSLPFFYSYGLSILNTHIYKNSNLIFTNKTIIQKNFWEDLKLYKCTNLSGIPYTYETIYKLKLYKFFSKKLKFLTQAGGSLNLSLIKFFNNYLKKNKKRFYVMYGQTEASPRIAVMPYKNLTNNIKSCGKALPGGKLLVKDSSNKFVRNKVGEIYYKGKNIMLGYALNYKDLEKKNKKINYLKTGDIGILDSKNFLTITGRSSSIAKISGLRIDLNDIKKFLENEDIVLSNDKFIYIISNNKKFKKNLIIKKISDNYNIHPFLIKFVYLKIFPRLSNGKINYKLMKNNLN